MRAELAAHQVCFIWLRERCVTWPVCLNYAKSWDTPGVVDHGIEPLKCLQKPDFCLLVCQNTNPESLHWEAERTGLCDTILLLFLLIKATEMSHMC